MIALPERVRKEVETPLMQRCVVALNRVPRVRAVRNNNGTQQNIYGDWFAYGLGDGSPDIVCRIEIGRGADILPCIFWIEVKTPHGRTTKKRRELQEGFRAEALTRGELSAVVYSEAEAVAAAERFRAEYTRRLEASR